MVTFSTVLLALLSGIIPALLWLLFWLQEDKRHPEPRMYIIATFLAGMAAVVLALPAEKFIQDYLGSSAVLMVLAWSAIEEILKFGAAWFTSLRKHVMDEPIDGIIYLITAALGFAALENALFLIEPISQSGLLGTIVTGNMRFVGATLVHILSSGIIGAAIALSYFRTKTMRELDILLGLILAIVLHGVFNFFIMQYSANTFAIFSIVWFAIFGLLVIFEKVKRMEQRYEKHIDT